MVISHVKRRSGSGIITFIHSTNRPNGPIPKNKVVKIGWIPTPSWRRLTTPTPFVWVDQGKEASFLVRLAFFLPSFGSPPFPFPSSGPSAILSELTLHFALVVNGRSISSALSALVSYEFHFEYSIMFSYFIPIALFVYGASAADCPAFGEYGKWTDQCLWFPLSNMRDQISQSCNVKFNVTNNATMDGFSDLMPTGFQIPEKCGQCSYKYRCRTRPQSEGCLAIDGEKQTCTEYSQICTVPPAPVVGCRWGMFAEAFKACTYRPDIPDWRRQAYLNFLKNMPEGNCIEKNGQCKCCCHPYQPNEEGTECVKVEENTNCPAFSAPNEYSQCLWFPASNIVNGFKDHCELDYKGEIPNVVPTPAGFQLPEKCGLCSFRIRCSKREKVDGCFHIQVEKKSCGNEDCPGCSDVCTIPYLNGTNCNWTQFIGQSLVKKVEAMTTAAKLPYWRKRGLKDLLKNLPYGKCKDINGQCKCCCHPYEPNADGTKCVLSDICSF